MQKEPVNSLDFSEDGSLVVCADSTTLVIYDTLNAKKIKMLFNKVNGIANVKFTHSNEAVICTSTKEPCKPSLTPDQVFYWSIHENEIIKVFEGHTAEIVMLNLNPSDDTFVTVSKNSELKVFDLSSEYASPEAELTVSEPGYSFCANFDITGVVLAVAVFKKEGEKCFNRIDLYDVKKFKEEDCRFDYWRIDHVPEITQIKFSNSGEYMLVGTVQSRIILLDAYEGKLLAEFSGFVNQTGGYLEACFTPDSRTIIGGSEDGTIYVWDIEKRIEVCKLEGHIKPSRHVKFSPTHVMMASACQNVLFWIPKFID